MIFTSRWLKWKKTASRWKINSRCTSNLSRVRPKTSISSTARPVTRSDHSKLRIPTWDSNWSRLYLAKPLIQDCLMVRKRKSVLRQRPLALNYPTLWRVMITERTEVALAASLAHIKAPKKFGLRSCVEQMTDATSSDRTSANCRAWTHSSKTTFSCSMRKSACAIKKYPAFR